MTDLFKKHKISAHFDVRNNNLVLRIAFICVIVMYFIHAKSANAQSILEMQVGTHDVKISGNDTAPTIEVDGKAVIESTNFSSASIVAGFELTSSSAVLISEPPGGSGCGYMFQAIFMTDSGNVVSKQFGNCGGLPKVSQQDDALVVDQSTNQGGDIYTVSSNSITDATVQPTLAGPVFHAGMDLAAAVAGKYFVDAFYIKAVSDRIQQLYGSEVFQKLITYGETSGTYTADGDYTVGFGSLPQDGDADGAVVVFDHHGGVWINTHTNGHKPEWLGNPPASAILAAVQVIPGELGN